MYIVQRIPRCPCIDTPRRARHPLQGLAVRSVPLPPGEKAARFSFEGHDFILDLSSSSLQPVPPETPMEKDRHMPRFLRKADMAGPPAIYETTSPDRRFFLGSTDRKLYLRSTADWDIDALTENGMKDYGWDSSGAL